MSNQSTQHTQKRTFRSRIARRKTLIVTVLGTAVFLTGILLGSLGPVGGWVRGTVLGSRGELDFATSQEIYKILQTDFDGELDRSALQHGSSAGVVAGTGDRFSAYLDPTEWAAFKQRMQGGTIGIGVELGFKNNELVIIAPQDGSPAKQAGLQAGDIIAIVDGTPVSEMSEQEAVQALRGAAGTTVQLTVLRNGQRLDFAVARQAITIPSVRSTITDDSIGVVTITSFDSNTARLAAAAAARFRAQNVRGVVLDMRDNPGGAVTAARDVTGLWVPRNSVVMVEKRGNTVLRSYKTTSNPVLANIPTVILLNSGSASASEVVTGALQDYDMASVVGTQSFGKGSVQQVRQLTNGGALSFTVSRWFTPKGRSIDEVGIKPDQTVQLSREEAATGRDTQMDAAIGRLVGN